MKRTLMVPVVISFLASPLQADVTIKQQVSGKGMGLSGQTMGTTYIKGHRMRSESQMGGKNQITIFDLDAQKLYMFDSKKKEADVWDMAAFSSELAKSVDTSSMKVSLKPNGQTKQIAGQSATGYDLEISMPTAIGGSKDMAMMVTMSGPTWIVKNAPGSEDYTRFYKAAADKGFVFGDPRAAKGSPGQARAMTEMYRALADAGGVAYESDMQIKMSSAGGNPFGGLMAKMGNMSMQTTVQSVEVGVLSDDLFAPPAGYKLNSKK